MEFPKPGQVFTDAECNRFIVTGISVKENGIHITYTNQVNDFTCLPEAFHQRFTFYGNYDYGKSSLK